MFAGYTRQSNEVTQEARPAPPPAWSLNPKGDEPVTFYLARRVLSLIATLWVVSTVTFLVIQIIPGDPAQLVLGTEASPGALEALRHEMGLDRPVLVRYTEWVGGALRGDLGHSIKYSRPVAEVVLERLPVTLSLAGLATVFAVVLGVPIGIYAATHRNTVGDYLTMAVSQAGMAVPSFWAGILLILVFSVELRLGPPGGYVSWSESPARALGSLVLPAIALAVLRAAILARITRSSMLEALSQDYVRTARGKGLAERVVLYRHALKNALIPTVTVLGIQLGQLFAGSIVIEKVFALPGLGRLVLSSIGDRDLPLLQGGVLWIALTVVVVNFAVDLAYTWLDPRIRLAGGGYWR